MPVTGLRRAWAAVVGAAVVVGLVALASNVTTDGQVTGHADAFKAVRLTLSAVVNSGTVWAGLVVLAGWWVRRPLHAAAAGTAAALTALVAHYGVGQLVGVFDASVWASNASWFAVALVAGVPLGLVGALARHRDRWGLLLAAGAAGAVAVVCSPRRTRRSRGRPSDGRSRLG